MIVILRSDTGSNEISSICDRIKALGCGAVIAQTLERVVIHVEGIPGPEARESLKRLRSLNSVEQVIPLSRPYERVARQPAGGFDVGGLEFGGESVVLMAGPCTVESEEQLFAAAEGIAHAGARVLRGGAYKPSTSPYSFHGLGVAALEMLKAAGRQFGLKVISEVMDPRKVPLVADHVDILQIGARNMQNFDLLREAGRSGMPVLLKRGMSARIEEWLLAAEYVITSGSEKVILCERGIRSFENATRNTLDLSSVPVVKSLCNLPIVVDPSHGTGRRDLIAPMSKAAIACGADGLLIEVHPNPEDALKDGAQSLSLHEFDELAPELRAVAASVGKVIGSRVTA
jgi:3-deoxy-7-phosphoheptulonate synthase